MTEFQPDFSNIEAGEASEFARKMLIEFVKQYAIHCGITQTEISKITGLHQSNIARVFSGKYSPELDTFLKVAGALNLHLELSQTDSLNRPHPRCP